METISLANVSLVSYSNLKALAGFILSTNPEGSIVAAEQNINPPILINIKWS